MDNGPTEVGRSVGLQSMHVLAPFRQHTHWQRAEGARERERLRKGQV